MSRPRTTTPTPDASGDHELRPARVDDTETVYQLRRDAYRPMVERLWGWVEGDQRRRFNGRYRQDQTSLVLLGGREVGALEVSVGDDEVFLASIAIHPDHQGRGLGTRIIEDLKDEAASLHLPLTLNVIRGNPAQRLYERLGFTRVREGEDRIWMEWRQES